MILNISHTSLASDIEEASLKLNGVRNCVGSVEDEIRYYSGRLAEMEYVEPMWTYSEEIAYNSICEHIDALCDKREALQAKELHLREFINHLEEADKALRWFEICEEEEG